MKRLSILLFLGLIIAGCTTTPSTREYVCPNGSVVSDLSYCNVQNASSGTQEINQTQATQSPSTNTQEGEASEKEYVGGCETTNTTCITNKLEAYSMSIQEFSTLLAGLNETECGQLNNSYNLTLTYCHDLISGRQDVEEIFGYAEPENLQNLSSNLDIIVGACTEDNLTKIFDDAASNC